MNVHVVCRDIGEDKILPRLAAYLRDGNGWTLSAEPDPSADLNHFIVYIDYAERHTDWHLTKVAAYFSHYEKGTPFKELWWDLALPQADIAVVTADQYGNMVSESPQRAGMLPPFKVRVPVDPQFCIMDKPKNERPRIGVSGWIRDTSGRKGERLAARLATDNANWDLVASGYGWPLKCLTHPREAMPEWYNSLDAFLCCSLIEGVPMPPLEALACGVPVIIPKGIGMLDDVPDAPGIFRYEAGNYDALKYASEEAVGFRLTKKAQKGLRVTISEYTPESWCFDHAEGFEKALSGGTEAFEERSVHGLRGVYYVAYGAPAKKCARAAMASWRKFMPDTPIALVSDEPLGTEDIFIEHPDDQDIAARVMKLRIYDLAPSDWRYILYMDADTEITSPVGFLFQLLEDGWDAVICKNPVDYHIIRNMVRDDNKQECQETFEMLGTDELLQLNGGVFGFQRNQRVKKFFKEWYAQWEPYTGRDQGGLVRALHTHPLKLYTLTNHWNTFVRDGYIPNGKDPREYTCGVLHYPLTARRWRGKVYGKTTTPEAWKMVREWEKGKV